MKKVKCARCGRKIAAIHWVDCLPYGKYCATQVESCLREQIKECNAHLKELEEKIRKLSYPQERQVSAPPTSQARNIPLSMNMSYGRNHSSMMDELRIVLKERVLN